MILDKPNTIAVVFDCDGTLVDSEVLHARALQAVLSGVGIELAIDEVRRRSMGIDNTSFLKHISEERRVILPSDLEATIERLTLHLISGGIQPIDGAVEVVHALAHEGFHLAIASNSTRRLVEPMLTAVNLRPLFDDRLATRDQVCKPKPAPDIYRLAADLLGTRCDRCLAVEDSPTGVTSAHEAGMKVVGFCPPSGAYRGDELLDAGAACLLHDLRALLRDPV